jgi:hypothetical protein
MSEDKKVVDIQSVKKPAGFATLPQFKTIPSKESLPKFKTEPPKD